MLDEFAVGAGRVVEVIGVLVLIAGAVLASVAFIVRLLRRMPFRTSYHELRADLGRAILLGLEFLVIADIIGTVAVEPTLQNLGVLAVIVAIRTLLPGDNQGERSASIRMRVCRGWADGGRA